MNVYIVIITYGDGTVSVDSVWDTNKAAENYLIRNGCFHGGQNQWYYGHAEYHIEKHKMCKE